METEYDPGRRRRRKRRKDGEEEVFNQMEDEVVGEETKREEEEGNEEKERKVVLDNELIVTEGEEEDQVKPESRLGAEEEAHEVQMEDNKTKNKKNTITEKKDDKEPRGLEEKEEKKKNRKRRGKKQSERVRNRRSSKDVSEPFEKEKRSQIQEVSVMSSEEVSSLSEPPIGLMNSCDLSDPVFVGCGGTGLFCPPVPVPLLYSSSQPPVPIQPAPPKPHGTKRSHSPNLYHSLPQQGPQPLEVRIECHSLTITYHHLVNCEHI